MEFKQSANTFFHWQLAVAGGWQRKVWGRPAPAPPQLRPTVFLVAGAGQLTTTSQLSLGLAAAASPALQPSTRFHHKQLGLQGLDTSVEVSLSSHLWLQLLVEDATTISSDRRITMPRGGRSKT